MSRRRTNYAGTAYTPLETDDDDDARTSEQHDQPDGFVDEQWVKPEQKYPWKTVLFILFFLIAGTVCLACSFLISSGFTDQKYGDRAWPLMILGILMFIPGGYYGYILLCIFLKRDGFTVEDIPML